MGLKTFFFINTENTSIKMTTAGDTQDHCWHIHLPAELVLFATTACRGISALCYHTLTQHSYELLYTEISNNSRS